MTVNYNLQDTCLIYFDLALERFKATGHRQVEDMENFVKFRKANRVDEMEFKIRQLLSATVNYDTVRTHP